MTREFVALAEARLRGGIAIRLPFDPSAIWGNKARHDVTGNVNGRKVRGKLTARAGQYYLELGPAWCLEGAIVPGAEVAVLLGPEGPQVGAMAGDIAAALEAQPVARRVFESLPTFYRKNFIRWIEQAKRPETRARRIAETVATLASGRRERERAPSTRSDRDPASA